MKKVFAALLASLFLFSFAMASSLDLSIYTDEELISLKNQINNELKQRKLANQAETPFSDFLYVSDGKEVCINAYVGPGGDVVIPDMIDGSKVTKIADKAFYDNGDKTTSLVLPKYLRYIGTMQFKGNKDLTGILVLPEELEEVGTHAFQSTGITGLVIQSNCVIKTNAFANLSNLEFIYIKEGCSPQISGKSTFSHGSSLKICVIPSSVKVIKDETFNACNYLTFVTPAGSFAEEYAKRNFIACETDSYEQHAAEYDSLY